MLNPAFVAALAFLPGFADLLGTDEKRYSLADFKQPVVIVVFTCNHCPVAESYEGRLKALAAWKPSEVAVVAINCNTNDQDRFPAMKLKAESAGFTFPYLYDPSQNSARRFGALATPEAFVLDSGRRIRYSGAIDDAIDPEKVRRRWVSEACAALLDGKAPAVIRTRAKGCGIKFDR